MTKKIPRILKRLERMLAQSGSILQRNHSETLFSHYFPAIACANNLDGVPGVTDSPGDHSQSAALHHIIDEKAIITYFQPIADLNNGTILGYEALSRGPSDGPLFWPDRLFTLAGQLNMLPILDAVCQETAIRTAATRELTGKLFVNICPSAITESFLKENLKNNLMELNIHPAQIVFEITERSAIMDFASFRRSTDNYRRQGFSIAIDDAGAGYSSLQSIAELHPEYIKIDRSLIQNIQESSLKKALVAALVECAHSIGSKVIGEGIETKAELAVLISLHVDYGQGFLFARPAADPPALSDGIAATIRQLQLQTDHKDKLSQEFGLTVGDVVEYCATVPAQTPVNELEELFADPNVPGVVVLDVQKPVGLLMKHRLYYQLGKYYGVSLYYHRPVTRVMDATPLIVSADLPIEAVSQLALGRNESSMYDLIIVVKDDRYIGTVSVIHLLKHVTNMQIHSAYNSNPLTGLPGNLVIEERLKTIIQDQHPFAVLYADLDNFKAFNDKYGFEAGDRAIMFTANVLNACLAEFGSTDSRDFLGHIGGDDFVLVTKPDRMEKLCQAILTKFDHGICSLYEPQDIAKGYIEVFNRKGKKEKFEIMTLSIAVVHNRTKPFENYLKIAEVAAELKKRVKAKKGSNWVIDQRN